MAVDFSKLQAAVDRLIADHLADKARVAEAEKAAQDAVDALAAKVEAADPSAPVA